ncbi:MAG: hypothetical protein KatS3mg023_0712 [Armatimonadota bacterium]|nr:MAG: hypothetical protein KatS3mg023_0712 [Armatimonadota bacterium]
MKTGDLATHYATLGYRVLPLHAIRDGRCTCGNPECPSPGKHPRTQHGVKDASADGDTIREWWTRYPDANVGIAVGRGVLVLDIDHDKGGLDSIRGKALPDASPCCRTGGGGWHYWFRLPDGVVAKNATSILRGVDIRTDGGYVVAPPSRHQTGRYYEWEQPLVPPDELPPAPDWLVQLLAAKAFKRAAVASWGEGTRHETALALAGVLRKRGVPQPEAEAVIREIACEARDPELEDRLRAVRDTYAKPPESVAGFSRLPQQLREAVDAHQRNGHDHVEVEPEKTYRHLLHLRELFAGRFRWCPEWKCWLEWNGEVWDRVPTEQVVATATEALRQHYSEQVATATSHREAEKWTKRLLDVFTTKHVADAVDLLRGYEGFITGANEFDADPYLLNCRNGLLNLRTLEMKPHDPDALCTKMVNAHYDPSADAPTWKRFLHEIFAGDTELIAFMQRACGMALIGENRHHLLFILHGAGGNGKSTFLHALRYTLGGYAGAIPRDALLARKHQQDAQRTAYSALIGLRFGTLEELADDVTLSVVAVKDLTSNNPMQVRALYENYREVRLGLTPFVAVNTKPSVTEHTEGTWRRLRLVPFTVTIPPEKRDPELPQKLEREADGILAWLVVGLREYWRCGLQEPPAVMEATREYRSEQDVLEGFITECCEISPRALTPSAELYNAYKQWAVQNGESEDELLSERAFGQRLTKRGFPTARGTDAKRTRLRKGLRLKMHVSDVSDVSDVDSEKSVRENDSGGLFGNNVRNVQNVQTHPSHDVACRNEPPPDYPVRDGRTGWCGVCQTTTVHRPYRLSNGMVHWQCVQCATVRLLEVPDG